MSAIAGINPGHVVTNAPTNAFGPGQPLFNVVTTAVPYQAVVGDLVVTSDSTVTAPVAPASGQYFAVKNVGVLPVTVVGTIDGVANFVLPPLPLGQEAVWFVWNAALTTWEIVSNYDLRPLLPGAALNLYVSAANGNDANNGLTPGTAVQTTAGLKRIFPALRFAPIVVHLGSGNYASLEVPPSIALATNCPIYLMGDGAGQAGDTGSTTVATGVTGAASTDLVVNAVVASKDLYQGMTLRFTSGALATAMRRHIRNNTTTTIVPAWRLNAVPAPGDTFAIERPAAIITYTDAYTFAQGVGAGQVDSPLVLVNIAFQGPSRAAQTPAHVVRISKCHVVMYGVSTQTGGSIQLVESYANAGTLYSWGSNQHIRVGNVPPLGNGSVTTLLTRTLGDLGVDPFFYQGWGISSPWVASLQTCPLLFDRAAFNGCLCAGFLPISSGSQALLTGGGLVQNGLGFSGQIYLAENALCYIQGTAVQRLTMTGGGGQNAPGNTWWQDSAGTCVFLDVGAQLEIEGVLNCSGNGQVIVENLGGNLFLTSAFGGTGALTISVTGTTGVGVRCTRGGKLISNGGSLTVTFASTIGNAVECHSGGQVLALDTLASNGRLSFGTDAKWTGSQGLSPVVTAAQIITTGFCEMDFSQSVGGSFTINAGAGVNAINLDHGSKLFLSSVALVVTGSVVLTDGAELHQSGAIGASSITSSLTALLSIARGCKVNLLGATSGTMTITSTGAPAVGVSCQGEFDFVNARISITGAVSACDFTRGGQICSVLQPTNVVGGTNDFLDEQGGFADTLLNAQTCVFTGQHPAGAYAANAPTGSGYVQRLS